MGRTITKTHHPEHYDQGVEPIDLIIANGDGPAACRSNIIKYISRYQRKGGMRDLLKAKQYLEWLIELESNSEVLSDDPKASLDRGACPVSRKD